jgi:glycosyltransferase involved in cell wall biosynthesis
MTERPHHVLYLIDQLRAIGGAERNLARMIRFLPEFGYRCSVVTLRDDPQSWFVESLACPVHVYPLVRTYDWNALVLARRLKHLIKAEEVAIAHTFFETSDLWGGLVAKLSGVPLLVSSRRDLGILRLFKHDVGYRLFRPMYDQVHGVSAEVCRYCVEHDRFDPRKVALVRNGIDIEEFDRPDGDRPIRDELGLPKDATVVVSVGHILRVKGLDTLLHAAAKVVQECPNTLFVVAGEVREQDHYSELLALVRRLGIEGNVKFVGGVKRIPALLKTSSVFCLLSRSEGLCNALLEAMAARLPCIATRVGGNPEVVQDQETGYLVPPNDPQAAAAALLELLRDQGRRTAMGSAGRAVVEKQFTVQAMVHRIADLYNGLLSTGN